MLHTVPSELIALILENLDPIAIIKCGLTCRRLYAETHDKTLWVPYLIPSIRATATHPEKAFFEKIEHCPVQFWHLHPDGIEAYKSLKLIRYKPMSNIAKARQILLTTQPNDYIMGIMALVHPDYRRIFLDDASSWPMIRCIMVLTYQHPKVLLYLLRDMEYKQTYLKFHVAEPNFFGSFNAVARTHHRTMGMDYPDIRKAQFEDLLNTIVDGLSTITDINYTDSPRAIHSNHA